MDNNILISIKSSQNNFDDISEVIMPATYKNLGDKHIITYQEDDLFGEKDTFTTLTAEPSKVTLTRNGANNSTMIFKPGERHMCIYDTPHGAFTLGITSKSVEVDMDDFVNGRIQADYSIDINNQLESVNRFCLTIKENTNNY
ncbi:MAG: DUF1934 domain-containing protein [Clostridiales bacterium]|jgi:uncharacterized beta-barrel protein YwiB (DUF1934 family)|nr:DUF1934 domain-containing protein [Clostridiales bacterium]